MQWTPVCFFTSFFCCSASNGDTVPEVTVWFDDNTGSSSVAKSKVSSPVNISRPSSSSKLSAILSVTVSNFSKVFPTMALAAMEAAYADFIEAWTAPIATSFIVLSDEIIRATRESRANSPADRAASLNAFASTAATSMFGNKNRLATIDATFDTSNADSLARNAIFAASATSSAKLQSILKLNSFRTSKITHNMTLKE
ncbi:hypothetical protein GCK72_023108 [Caenorhabditis remanei]|uniref:Uncharacterized protein n=1 Tax=Caenorhabditis remanei TaxID=31234 RepID=A0A6A5FW24_CAERE|nr:hypothetical protein GCK72_023108 [Caenorhabditis remanei]KAF1746651.1 hypothetical protein GCK72_023108 [Caenorhabditis remanei]